MKRHCRPILPRPGLYILIVSIVLLLFSDSCPAQAFDKAVTRQQAILFPYEKQIRARLDTHEELIGHIFKQLRHYTLPEQLVLLPMLESSFNVTATSHAGARGLWQLMPDTAERFGLSVKPDDQRLNIYDSTRAALSYLKFLHQKFNGNLMLTLAAYNAGEGRVERAIQQAGTSEFQRLNLPQETRRYVHRFYALAGLIDTTSLNQRTFRPMMLFGSDQADTRRPLIDLGPLPPLVKL